MIDTTNLPEINWDELNTPEATSELGLVEFFEIDCDELEFPFLIKEETKTKMDNVMTDLIGWFENPYPIFKKLDSIGASGNRIQYWTENDSCLQNVVNCFNIIRKEFKLIQEQNREYYSRWFTSKPFTAFEETGIEVLYARRGYSIDGKRMPSFNRGSVYGLKHSLKLNKIKQKGLSKKDDIIKALLKL